jgi:hypothetical protein
VVVWVELVLALKRSTPSGIEARLTSSLARRTVCSRSALVLSFVTPPRPQSPVDLYLTLFLTLALRFHERDRGNTRDPLVLPLSRFLSLVTGLQEPRAPFLDDR